MCKLRRNKREEEDDDDEEVKEDKDKGLPVDRGWAWVIVAGLVLMNVIMIGMFKSFGIIYVELQEVYDASPSIASWVASAQQLTFALFAPLAGYISDLHTNRLVVLIGAVFMVFSIFISSFATSIYVVILTYGIMAGSGMSFVYGPAMVMIGKYFTKRRALANGIASAGSSVGFFVLPPIIRFLIDEYSLSGALMFISGISLHIILAGTVLRPIEFYKKKDTTQQLPQNEITRESFLGVEEEEKEGEKETMLPPGERKIDCGDSEGDSLIDITVEKKGYLDTDQDSTTAFGQQNEDDDGCYDNHDRKHSSPKVKHTSGGYTSLSDIPEGLENILIRKRRWPCGRCTSSCNSDKTKDLSALLRNVLYVMFVVGTTFANFAYISQLVILPDYHQEIGIDKSGATFLMSLTGIAELVGRLSWGFLLDIGVIRKTRFLSIFLGISGVAVIVMTFLPMYQTMIGYHIIFGLFGGTYIIFCMSLLPSYVGLRMLATAMGITMLAFGMSSTFGPALLGMLKDVTGTYKSGLWICGVGYFIGMTAFLLEPVAKKYTKIPPEWGADLEEEEEGKEIKGKVGAKDSMVGNTESNV